MSRYFSFRFKKTENSVRASLVLFCQSELENSSLLKEIKDDVTSNLIPSDVIILGYEVSEKTKINIFNDEML